MTTDRWFLVKALFQDAVDRAPAEREAHLAAACGGDADLRAAVDRLLAAHSDASGFLESTCPVDPALLERAPPADDPAPSQIGPYRVIRELGRGGMGTVYLADRDDPSLRRTVAIKVVNVASRQILRRFRAEIGVLASLEHPGIARLYDAGTTAAGVPYFVMEFVAGSDLLQYCHATRASIRDRLRLFHQVCAAVQYAHQNFIVHRDLKPSNILVTPDGEPKLLDFGIAKLLSAPDDALDETALFGKALTPQYSSPEHIRGERVTTASDVYSLGVVLYELLCGSRPYRITGRTAAEIERAVVTQEAKAPSAAVIASDAAGARASTAETLQRQLQGDLDNIVLKALRKAPSERYATAADFADDIQRYLDGYPVLARPSTVSYRAAKFLRRHHRSVAVAALATLALVVSLGLALWQAHVARLERDRANQRFGDVRRMANALIFKIHDGVQALPNSTPVRRMIIAEALTYLETLSRDPAADESLRIELAQAYQRIGIVQGQGNVFNLGDRQGAIASFRKGLGALRPLMTNPTAHSQAAIQFGRTALSLATTVAGAGDPKEAIAATREAETVAAALVASPLVTDDARRLLASVHFQYALLTPAPESLMHWQRAGDIFDALLAARPEDADRQRNVALVQKYLGASYDTAGDAATALVHHGRAQKMDEERVQRNPGDRTALADLAIDVGNVAHAQWQIGRLDEAAAGFERSLGIRQQLADADPNDVFAKGRVAFVHTRLADVYGRAGKVRLSLDHARLAAHLIEGIGQLDPTHRAQLAETWTILGEAERRNGAPATACRLFRQSQAIFHDLAGQKITARQQPERDHQQTRLAADLQACQPQPDAPSRSFAARR
jgi:eukaryotic-like serine/threonine-protein kinase